VRTVVDEGKENPCVHKDSSEWSCLVVKVSGIDPRALRTIWWNEKTTGGVHVAVGEKRYSISSFVIRPIIGGIENKCAVLEVTVPKVVSQFALVISDKPPVAFQAAPAVTPRLNCDDLFRPRK
jgi:hypothetical protein